jgi:UDP-N-acetyl-alpha-D-muramoyl-L-alanyl-L-glutamate epimerase
VKEYKAFYFEGYEFDGQARAVRLQYSFDKELKFTHTVSFDFEFQTEYNREVLNKVLRGLWLLAGVSYYKAALPPKVIVVGAELSAPEAEFFSKTYRLGLGQLLYENNLSLKRVARFDASMQAPAPVKGLGAGGDLVALGGGKDSLVSTTVLEAAGHDFATFSAAYSSGAGRALADLGELVGRPYLGVRRTFDPALLELTRQGGYNGHVPVTAEIMFIGLAAAILSGRRRVIFSNEASAGEGNVSYEGESINHQYSKSPGFEREFREYLHTVVSPELDCFSLLRPLGDLRIAELFAHGPMQRFAGHFTSCNRSFRHGSSGFTWCGECPKCAYVFLALAPFVAKNELEALWGDNLLAKPGLEATYRELLGLTGHKPFECVGEIEECRQAVRMIEDKYPEVKRFEVPAGEYDWRELHAAPLPGKYRELLINYLAQAKAS